MIDMDGSKLPAHSEQLFSCQCVITLMKIHIDQYESSHVTTFLACA